ncbi:MAG TPA: UDP-N-acetylmuramoyl-L-alanyl-D-glutamate--2,6-diaminopimelate ligase [Actinomycetota bacterium]|nr:UDP-N-acetylmuramoyl-L-alanyl-D-glutamate--2,6-diaminopimelate ligase [Actinomycetota bacterium]
MGGEGGSALGALAAAAGELVAVRPDGDALVAGVSYDSRGVQPGDLFFCVPGARHDGHEFAAEAVAAGAVALCTQRPVHAGVPEIVVSDVRRAMARIGAAFFGRPADRLLLVGVTGTNGKTTTAYLVRSILAAAGHSAGLIGTVETVVAGERRPGVRTTPESLDLHALFAEMVHRGVSAAALEVTSHALALGRVEGVRFACAAFTNLSQDHLDFHRDMEAYFAAKRSLFVPERTGVAAVNLDDPYGRRLAAEVAVPVIGFGAAPEASVRALEVVSAPSRTRIVARTPVGDLELSTRLVGGFNVANCLTACACALGIGVGPDAIASGIEGLSSVPGRFEAVDRGQPFSVIVDYAHTPDSLDNVLREARRMATARGGRLLCVFGCGGDRDRTKRPLMGAAAARLADVVVVTSDNPRSEAPEAIIEEVLAGVLRHRPDGADLVLVDRREAIQRTVARARPGDVVLIAGRGHETGQEIAGRTIAFDDREVAAAALDAAGRRVAG